MTKWLKNIIPLVIVLVIVLALTLIPFSLTRSQLRSDERIQSEIKVQIKNNLKVQTYLCKFSFIMREFSSTAADARFVTSQKGTPALRSFNAHVAHIYSRIHRELKQLPPDSNCKKLIKGSK